VPLSGDSVQDRDFQMPVFAFVFTKFRKMPDAKPVSTQANYTDFFCIIYALLYLISFPVFTHCWLGDWKDTWPFKILHQ